jgi:hypothetical protein
MRIFRTYEPATTSLTVRNSWGKVGFEFGFQRRDGAIYLFVHEGKIWESPEFAELWRIDDPEMKLSGCRRQQRWGWLNKWFFRVEYRKKLPPS